MRASEWLSSPDKWCQHSFYRDENGRQCNERRATSACISAVITLVSIDTHLYDQIEIPGDVWNQITGIEQQLTEYMQAKYNNTWTLEHWNDDPDTTWQMVYDLLVEVGV